MDRSNTCREIDPDPVAASNEEETAKLPSLSHAANDENRTLATDQISAKLDELIALSRSIHDHLEYLVGKQKTPAWAPKNKHTP